MILMERVWSEDLKLLSHDVDHKAFWKPSSIFANTQEVANSHSTHLGSGWKQLMSSFGICWVLTRMKLEMKEYPKVEEIVRIKTWPDPKARLVFTRHFTFEREDGTQLGSAVSQWVLIDVQSRAVVKPSNYNIVPYDTNNLPTSTIALGKMPVNAVPQSVSVRRPVYSDLDYNEHVNNARYIEWISDLFDPSVFDNKRMKMIDIKFCSEIRYGSDVILELSQEAMHELSQESMQEKNGSRFYVKGKNSDGIVHFEVMGEIF